MSIIALIIPTLKQGGAERVLSELANIWSHQGYTIHMILLAKGERFYNLDGKVVLHQLGFQNISIFGKIISEVRTFIKLRNLLKEIEPSIALSFMTKYNVFTILSSAFLNIPVFVSDRSSPKKTLPFLTGCLRKFLYRFADGIIAQTSIAKDILTKETENKNICVIPNPIKNFEFDNVSVKEPLILNAGRLIPEKGQKELLQIFSRIENKQWKLVILGEGPLRGELEELAHELGITSRIEMPGSVTNVDEWLSRASVFAFTSISEGFPNALGEAMAAGLACISFDCVAGPSDLIDDEINGYLVPIDNNSLYVERLKSLIDKKELRSQFGGLAKIKMEEFRLEKVSQEYLDFMFDSNAAKP